MVTDSRNSTCLIWQLPDIVMRCSKALSLMSHILKILQKVIFKRNKYKIESVISETQSGFIAGKGTREGIYDL